MNWADRFGEWLAAPVRRWRYARRQDFVNKEIARLGIANSAYNRKYIEETVYGDLLPPTR